MGHFSWLCDKQLSYSEIHLPTTLTTLTAYFSYMYRKIHTNGGGGLLIGPQKIITGFLIFFFLKTAQNKEVDTPVCIMKEFFFRTLFIIESTLNGPLKRENLPRNSVGEYWKKMCLIFMNKRFPFVNVVKIYYNTAPGPTIIIANVLLFRTRRIHIKNEHKRLSGIRYANEKI